jgi:peptidyl-prolyl cis-trans isomerase D
MVHGDETLLNQPFIRANCFRYAIARTVLLQQAEKLGISLSDGQIEKMLAQQPSFQENGKFSQTLYENYLRSVGMTSQALITSLRQDHALKMLTSSINGTALVSKADINQIATLQTEQRTLHLASIKLDDYKKDITVSNQEISDYYNKHQNSFKQVASVDVDYVVLSPVQVVTNAPVTDAELQQAYKAFVEKQQKDAKRDVKHILITTDARSDAEAQKLANDVYAKISAGTLSFADAAQQYSDDTSSKNEGGLLQHINQACFRLNLIKL